VTKRHQSTDGDAQLSARGVRRNPVGDAPAASSGPTKPFIKWAGGKTRLLPRLLPHFPESFHAYHEPFLGGGASFFAAGARRTGGAYLSDLSEELVNAWQVVREHGGRLSRELKPYHESDSEEFYYSLRPLQPQDPVDRACRFLYLNQTSWNGLWRVNRWGEFNVPWGQRPFRGFSAESLDAYSSLLRDVDVSLLDFREALSRARKGDFVYLDPPYLPLSDTSKFFLYTEKRFRAPDLRELASACEELSSRGVTWILSNRDTPLVRELFDHAEVIGLTTKRSVAAQNRRDVEPTESAEVIVRGGGAR
jgi:DNA adenine methylase